MKLYSWFLIIVLMILLAVCLIVFPFIYAVDNTFLSEDFSEETLNDLGTYDAAYDLLRQKLNETTVRSAEENGLTPEAAEWIAENILLVFNRDYTTGLMEEQAAGMVAYLTGDTDTLPELDLEPKYEELKQVTEDRLDADAIMMLLDAEPDSIAAILLDITGIVNDSGEVNPVVKQYAVDLVFDANPEIEAVFQIKNPLEAMALIGMENPGEQLDQIRNLTIMVHRGSMLLLLAISCLTALILLIGIRKIRVPILINAWTYTATSVLVIVISASVASGSRVIERLSARMGFPDTMLAEQLHVDALADMFGKSALSVGLVFLGAGIVFFILSFLFGRKKRREKMI